jgi:hypothetical protein
MSKNAVRFLLFRLHYTALPGFLRIFDAQFQIPNSPGMNTRIKALVFISIVISFSFVRFPDPCRNWDKYRKLTWEDYEGSSPVNPEFNAITRTRFNYTVTLNKDSAYIDAQICFLSDESWVISGYNTSYLLNHEQRHFDIAEVYTRMFRKYAAKWNGKGDLLPYLAAGKDSILAKQKSVHTLYDAETEHSIITPAQQKWDLKIDSLLESYSSYEKPVVKIYYKRPATK